VFGLESSTSSDIRQLSFEHGSTDAIANALTLLV